MTSSAASLPAPSRAQAIEPIGYRTDCPKCGKPLAPVALDPDTAPWLCNECHRGFWSAELTDVARARYRHRHHDWGQGAPAQAIRRSVQTEWLQAHARGASLRPDQLRAAHKDHLIGLRDSGLTFSDDFAEAVATELEARG